MNVTKTAITNFLKELDFLELVVCVVAAFIMFIFNFDSEYPNRVPVPRRALNPLFIIVTVPNWE